MPISTHEDLKLGYEEWGSKYKMWDTNILMSIPK